jgi:hypothetical protein
MRGCILPDLTRLTVPAGCAPVGIAASGRAGSHGHSSRQRVLSAERKAAARRAVRTLQERSRDRCIAWAAVGLTGTW